MTTAKMEEDEEKTKKKRRSPDHVSIGPAIPALEPAALLFLLFHHSIHLVAMLIFKRIELCRQ